MNRNKTLFGPNMLLKTELKQIQKDDEQENQNHYARKMKQEKNT